MFNIGPTELIVVLVIALIVFGPRRLPEVGRTIGKSLREFRRASEELKDELRLNLDDDDLPATSPAPGEPGYANWSAGKASANGSAEAADAGDSSSPEEAGGAHAI